MQYDSCFDAQLNITLMSPIPEIHPTRFQELLTFEIAFNEKINKNIFGMFTEILFITAAFFIGRSNYSLGWLILLFLSSVNNYLRQQRLLRQAYIRATSSIPESHLILSRLDDIPAWVIFPDVERAEWINTIFKHLWPKINLIVEKKLRDYQMTINEHESFKKFKFEKINLGKITPRVTGIKVHMTNVPVDDILIDVNISYVGDSELIVSLNGFQGGIKNLQVEGKIRIGMKNLSSLPPFISEVEISFLESPTFDFEFSTALVPLDMFATGDLLRSFINEEISRRLVFPNKIIIKVETYHNTGTEELPKIVGIIQVKLHYVSELNGHNGQIAQAHLNLGLHRMKTSKVTISENVAVINFHHKIPIFSHDAKILNISIEVKDDTIKMGTFQGFIDVSNLYKDRRKYLTCKMSPHGVSSVDLLWLSLSSDQKDLQNQVIPNENCTILEIYIDSVKNIKYLTSTFVMLSIGEESKITTVINPNSESWRQHFTFFINDHNSAELHVEVIDNMTSRTIGNYVFRIHDLVTRKKMSQNLQEIPLNQSNNDSKILMLLKLHAVKFKD
ncbi:CLUMA_CG012752, isoform A [Clunio marinus]|uniref:CLUMA_CG012752, isoform A n=1 Tax=Clunio marinus TaxID=568069 RepID=A0A1J1ILL6_9DIPT|nr:CLUMA_CG012752, isoform A [Clunio marinus]